MNTLKQDDNNLIPLNIDGKEYSAILSGLNSKVFRSVDITALQNEPGWIFDDEERMEPWNLIGISEHRGCMVFYGPLVEGREFTSADLDLEKLNRMVHLFQALRNKKMSYQGFYSRGWIFLNDGRILLLPNSLMEFIRKSDNEKTRMLHWYPYNHPDHSGLKGLEFTAAILSATLLKGQHPYAPLETEEDNRNEQLRRSPLLSPDLLIPGLKKEISQVMARSFKGESQFMKQWIDALDLWVKEGPVNALSKEELQTIEAKASQRVERGEKNQRRRQIWRQKNTFFMITAITVILLGVIVGTPIRKSLEPPVTMGMEAREVIHSYYDGFNTMNQEIMEDSIDKKVGKGDLTEVTNFFVTSRVRMGYEGKSGVLSAAEWVASGRPELESGINLYGVAELSIEDLGEGQFRVSYEKWIPGSSNEIDQVGPIPPEGYFVTDLVTLEKQKKGNWLIVGLNRSLQKITE